MQEHTIPFNRLQEAQTIVAHDGFDYTGTSERSVDTAITVLIPDKTGNRYEACKFMCPNMFWAIVDWI